MSNAFVPDPIKVDRARHFIMVGNIYNTPSTEPAPATEIHALFESEVTGAIECLLHFCEAQRISFNKCLALATIETEKEKRVRL